MLVLAVRRVVAGDFLACLTELGVIAFGQDAITRSHQIINLFKQNSVAMTS